MPLRAEGSGRFNVNIVRDRDGSIVASEQFFRGTDRQREADRDAMLRTLSGRGFRERLSTMRADENSLRRVMTEATLRAGLTGRSGHKRFHV